MASWADNPVGATTHIRAIHVNELRKTVLRNRYAAGEGWYQFSDAPWVNSRTHFRWTHFTELHDAMATYLGTLNWTAGSTPSASRQLKVSDMQDLRTWCDRFSQALTLPTGPDPAIQGITSFSFDPTQTPNASIDGDWVDDIAGLTPTTTPLWLRTTVYSDTNDEILPYYGAYQAAFQLYETAHMPVQAHLTGEFARTDYENRNQGVSDSYFTNLYIDYFAAAAKDFALNMASSGARSYIIWNEPDDRSGAYLDARAFGSLMYNSFNQINSLQLGLGIIMGGILWPIGLPKPGGGTYSASDATQYVLNYLTPLYSWLTNNGLGIPWDAVNVHIHHCSFSQQDMTNLRSAIDGVFATSDRRPVFVGEWGATHQDATDPSCMANAYTYLRNTFDAMWYFQHPTQSSGCCGPSGCSGDFGTAAWTFKQGASYKDYSVQLPHCSEWGQLSTLLEQRGA